MPVRAIGRALNHEAARRQAGDQTPGDLVIVFDQKNTD